MCQGTPNPLEGNMIRSKPNKHRSANQFRKGTRKTHRKNLQIMRGGWRL